MLRRPFLEGNDEPWIHSRRLILHAQRLRALDCLVDALAWNGELTLALTHADEVIELEPYRERGYQRLMRLHSQLGDRAKALQVLERCRTVLSAELGVDPSPETMPVHRELFCVAKPPPLRWRRAGSDPGGGGRRCLDVCGSGTTLCRAAPAGLRPYVPTAVTTFE
ncbi:MAG TPA: bacterial transcriptional activator domain-containing protein [Candidatus Dormibacteraeota bacterium]|nr:bacterial transcriptional activator domain-containing protein [Candidatus Dormibacteraeota bacterium]